MANVLTHSLFTDYDIYLFRQGKHFKLYEKFGAHPIKLKILKDVILQSMHQMLHPCQ